MTRARQMLRDVSAPHEAAAEARAWEIVRAVYAERSPIRAKRRRGGLAVLPAAVALVAALALSPAGAAVHRWIDRTLGLMHARPALFSLPTPGRILVVGRGGVWTIAADGAKRRLAAGSAATWSPHGRYVAIAQQNQLAALDRHGTTRWSIARPSVRFPEWFAPNGYRLAYLSAGTLRVIAGDGSGDRLLARQVAPVAAAWRPGYPYQLAYVRRDGAVIVRDADTGVVMWSRRLTSSPRLLRWSSDGRRLLILTSDAALLYDGSGRRIARVSGGPGLRDAALSPDGRSVALLAATDLDIGGLDGRTHRLFAGLGLSGLAWSPDGQWLLVGWPAADQWVFLRATRRPRIIAVSRIAQQFGSFPTLNGWCCTPSGTSGQ